MLVSPNKLMLESAVQHMKVFFGPAVAAESLEVSRQEGERQREAGKVGAGRGREAGCAAGRGRPRRRC